MKRFVSLIIIALLIFTGVGFAQDQNKAGYIIITSENIKEITQEVKNAIERVVGGLSGRELDYKSPEAKQWIDKMGILALPFVIYDKKIVDHENFFGLVKSGGIDRRNNEYYIPEKEVQYFGLMFFKRQHIPKRLDIFIMSQCPAGNDAMRQLDNLLKNDPAMFTLASHYIATFREFGVDSLRGPGEIKEDINQILFQKYYPDKFLPYLRLYRDGRNFEDACKELGIDSARILSLHSEGLELLKEDAALCNELGIVNSPMFLWENQVLLSSINELRKFLKIEQPSGANLKFNPEGKLVITSFYSANCGNCTWLLDEVIPGFEKKYGKHVIFENYDISIPENLDKKLGMEKEIGVLSAGVPEIFIGNRTIIGKNEIEEKLEKAIKGAIEGKETVEKLSLRATEGSEAISKGIASSPSAPRNDILAVARNGTVRGEGNSALERFKTFTPLAVASAGVLDGINPCAFSTVIFLSHF